nr:hypothetical protein [uncultured Acetatifactor sp.]
MLTPNRLLMAMILSMSGIDAPLSHLLTDCLEMFSCSASSSCDQLFFFRNA